MNKAYEFISYPYESFSLVAKTTSTLAIHDHDISLDDMLLEFTKFLRASGYIIDSDQHLSVVSEEELEDYEGLFDEDEDWEEQFYSGESDITWEPVENSDCFELVNGPNHTFEIDMDGMKKYQERITNGFRLFGKYYENLWD